MRHLPFRKQDRARSRLRVHIAGSERSLSAHTHTQTQIQWLLDRRWHWQDVLHRVLFEHYGALLILPRDVRGFERDPPSCWASWGGWWGCSRAPRASGWTARCSGPPPAARCPDPPSTPAAGHTRRLPLANPQTLVRHTHTHTRADRRGSRPRLRAPGVGWWGREEGGDGARGVPAPYWRLGAEAKEGERSSRDRLFMPPPDGRKEASPAARIGSGFRFDPIQCVAAVSASVLPNKCVRAEEKSRGDGGAVALRQGS